MRITLKKLTDEQNNLGFDEVVLLERYLACTAEYPAIKDEESPPEYKLTLQEYSWLFIGDGVLNKMSEEDLFESLAAYEVQAVIE